MLLLLLFYLVIDVNWDNEIPELDTPPGFSTAGGLVNVTACQVV